MLTSLQINFASFRSIRINYTPQIQFQESPKPLASRMTQPKNSNTDKSYTSQVSQQLHSSTSRTDAATRPFSINDFAPPTPQQYPLRYQPPTPPPEDDDDGAMDWTPSQEKQMLRPMASYRPLQSASKPSQPSPFYGRLPADVVSQAQQLRNPPNQPVFRKASAAKTTEFFLTPKKYDMRDHYNTSPSEYEPSVAATTPVLSPIKFAQPRFFPQSDHEVLGFESRMANSLSLDDEPPEVRAVHQNHAQRNLENQSALNSICAQWHRILALVLLVASRVFWSNTATTSPIVSEVHSRLVAVGVISTLCARLLFLGMRKAHWSSANILIFTFELVACGFTGAVIQEPSKISLSSLGPKARDLMGPALISWLAVQESCMLFLEVWTQRNRNNGILSSTTVHTATSARLDRNQSTSLEQAPTHTSSVEQKPVPASRRSTPLRTKLDRNSGVHNDLGGLSLDGFGRSEQASGIGSMGLGQPQRRMQNGMW